MNRGTLWQLYPALFLIKCLYLWMDFPSVHATVINHDRKKRTICSSLFLLLKGDQGAVNGRGRSVTAPARPLAL